MTGYKRIRIEREELFKQIGGQSMVQSSKVYGLSDVRLRKTCKLENFGWVLSPVSTKESGLEGKFKSKGNLAVQHGGFIRKNM